MVEFFTKEHDTNLSEERASMVEIVDETITQNLKSNLQKLVKEIYYLIKLVIFF